MFQMSMLEENLNPPATLEVTGSELGRQRLESLIKRGRESTEKVIQYVRGLQPTDYVVKLNKITFELADSGKLHAFLPSDIEEKVHPHALGQATSKTSIPWVYASYLQEKGGWGMELLASNLNELLAHMDGKALLRSVNGEIRGFLSDRYRRLDSRPIVDAFAKACKELGAVPYRGYLSDTKLGIQAILPRVYEPIANEVMAYGVNFENSDFGNGALNIGFFLLRLTSAAGIIGQTGMRKIHLGAKLEENIEWSKKTYEYDQKTVISSINDLVRGELSEERIKLMQSAIKQAYMTRLDDEKKATVLELLKRFMTKGELEKALKKFNEPDIEELPAGNNIWRLSNAISWLSGETEDDERKLELMKVAGKILPEVAAT